MGFLTPQTVTAPRPSQDELSLKHPDVDLGGRILYLRSYLGMRAAIGFIGVALPVVLLLGDWFFLAGGVSARGSLSAYYHSGMRDVFVGTLCAAAIFLITYKAFEHNLDNTLSTVAGLAALGVALFPTSRPLGGADPLTPLQQRLGEATTTKVHFTCAVIFILFLAAISFCFGLREGRRKQERDGRKARMSPTFWRYFHWSCTGTIVLALAFIGITKSQGWLTDYSILIGEVVAVFAFGLSWLMKGLELDVLLSPDVAAELKVASESAL